MWCPAQPSQRILHLFADSVPGEDEEILGTFCWAPHDNMVTVQQLFVYAGTVWQVAAPRRCVGINPLCRWPAGGLSLDQAVDSLVCRTDRDGEGSWVRRWHSVKTALAHLERAVYAVLLDADPTRVYVVD